MSTYNYTQQQTQLQYSLYVSDIMGTTTPKSHISESTQYISNNIPVLEDIAQELGYESTSQVTQAIEKGTKAKKGTDEFNTYLTIWDIGAMKGYQRREICMPLEEGVKETVQKLKSQGSRFVIFSSGGRQTSKEGMKTNGLDDYIDAYYSSSQQEIGSKYTTSAYLAIARAEGKEVSDICYVTDDAKEAQAATEAGYGKVLFIKPDATNDEKNAAEQCGYVIIDNYSATLDETSQTDNTESTENAAEVAE